MDAWLGSPFDDFSRSPFGYSIAALNSNKAMVTGFNENGISWALITHWRKGGNLLEILKPGCS